MREILSYHVYLTKSRQGNLLKCFGTGENIEYHSTAKVVKNNGDYGNLSEKISAWYSYI